MNNYVTDENPIRGGKACPEHGATMDMGNIENVTFQGMQFSATVHRCTEDGCDEKIVNIWEVMDKYNELVR